VTSTQTEPAQPAEFAGRGPFFAGIGLYFVSGGFAAFVPEPTPFQWVIFGLLASLASPLITSTILGHLEVRSKWVRASGNIAVFVVALFAVMRVMPEATATAATTSDTTPTLLEQGSERSRPPVSGDVANDPRRP
jgi:hypothetical protein